MKRYIKYCGIAICILTLVFSLTSCFTTPPSLENFISWEFNDDLSTVTNGEEVYDLRNADTVYWRMSGNHTFHYLGDAEANADMIADISRPIDDDDILFVDFYDQSWRDYKYSAIYSTEEGLKKLNDLKTASIFGKPYLVDSEGSESAKLTEEFKNTLWKLTNEPREHRIVGSANVSDADKLEVVSYGLDGFVKHVHGVFIYYRATVYYLDLDSANENYYDIYGNLVGVSFPMIELNDDDRKALTAAADEMDNFVYEIEYEEPKYTSENDPEAGLAVARTILSVVTAFFGIVLPIIPIVFALRIAIKKKWHIELMDYILLGASAVWIISGIVVFILILV